MVLILLLTKRQLIGRERKQKNLEARYNIKTQMHNNDMVYQEMKLQKKINANAFLCTYCASTKALRREAGDIYQISGARYSQSYLEVNLDKHLFLRLREM